MKRHLHFLLIATTVFIVTAQSTNAQNSSPYWSLAGNSNATTSSKLGTTNAIALRILTNNTVRIYVSPSAGYVGVGTATPTDRLHINSAAGKNILRGQVNGITKLLVHSNGGVAIGSGTTPPSNGLYVSGRLGLGIATPSYKLHVVGTDPYATIVRIDNGGLNVNIPWSTGDESIGIRSDAGIGVYGSGMTGVQGEGMTGVYGTGYQGVYGVGQGEGDGVFGYSEEGTGIHGSTANADAYAGYFDGNVYSSGTFVGSDRSLKTNIADFSTAMAIIGKLQPKSYEYRQDGNYKLMNLPQGKHFGLIAQDVEQVLPDLVKATIFDTRHAKTPERPTAGATSAPQPSETIAFKALNYTELIPIIVKGMQEQDRRLQEQEQENKALKSEIAELRRMVQELKGAGNTVTSTSSYLEQNTPNPVSGITTIRYHLPEGITSATVTLTTAKGQLVKTISIGNGSSGQITLNTSMFASGTYNYTLYMDGKPVESKRLVIAR